MADRLCTIKARCHDLPATAAFLTAIGFRSTADTGTYACLERDGLAIELYRDASPDPCRGVCVVVPVGDGFDGAVAELRAAGVQGRWLRDDHGSPFADFVVTAPNGLEISFSGLTSGR